MNKPYSGTKTVTSHFGHRRFRLADGSWYEDFHNGIDFGGIFDVLASESGTIKSIGTNGIDRGGKLVAGTPANYVIINHGNGLETLYWHLGSVGVKVGQKVTRGQKIGVSGRTGVATGYHLHFMIRKNGVDQDPRNYIDFNSNNLITSNNMEKYIVQPNDSVSRIATKFYGSDTANNMNLIAKLNGYANYLDFNKNLHAGNVINVRQITTPKIEDTAEVKKLKEQIEKINKETAESERKAKEREAELIEKNNKLDLVTRSEIAKILEEKQSQKEEYERKLNEINSEIESIKVHTVTDETLEVATHLILEEVKARGIKAKVHSWIDKNIQSDRLRSFLKYDWFYIILVSIAFYTALIEKYGGENDILLAIFSVTGGLGSQITKYIVTNYDKNKDGIIDIKDTSLYGNE